MNDQVRRRATRSPNYPQQSLEWAVSCGLSLLEKEKLHPVPVDIVAQNLGYKDANNGKARRVLANLKAFGILEKASGGKLAVSQDVQRYKLAPLAEDRAAYLQEWLRRPSLYAKLLDKYPQELPSNKVLIFELVDDFGFSEDGAQKAIEVFLDSLRFVDSSLPEGEGEDASADEGFEDEASDLEPNEQQGTTGKRVDQSPPEPRLNQESNCVRYPVRLAGGRMAYIDVPDPFFEVDKGKLKAQLEVIGTVDEDNEFEGF